MTITAQGTSYALDEISSWRFRNRRNRAFGLKPEPLPPMDEVTAETLLSAAYDASWDAFGITREECRAEVIAIRDASRAEWDEIGGVR